MADPTHAAPSVKLEFNARQFGTLTGAGLIYVHSLGAAPTRQWGARCGGLVEAKDGAEVAARVDAARVAVAGDREGLHHVTPGSRRELVHVEHHLADERTALLPLPSAIRWCSTKQACSKGFERENMRSGTWFALTAPSSAASTSRIAMTRRVASVMPRTGIISLSFQSKGLHSEVESEP